MTRHFTQKKVNIGSGSWVWTQIRTQNQNQFDSEFISIHFGIEINKHIKFSAPIIIWIKKDKKILENLFL